MQSLNFADTDTLTDEELIAALQSGADFAYRRLIGRYENLLKRYVWNIVFSRDQTDDIVHDAFVDFWMHYVQAGRPIENVRALLFRIARNRAVDWVRRQKVRRWFRLNFQPVYEVENPYVRLVKKDEQAKVMHSIAKLPCKDREILELVYVEKMTMADAAQILSIGEEAVSSRLRRARARLKELLSDSFGYGVEL